ncbi:MAG: magnesium transporter [Oscillospiraceae bacterium]|nr:magnesium transporter [Oscillospiraceae bacterium]
MEGKEIFLQLIDLLRQGKIAEFKALSLECPPVDIAEGIDELDAQLTLRVFRLLPKDISADVFSYLSSDQQQVIAETASGLEMRHIIDDMFLDDTVDFLEEMPANLVTKVLQNASAQTRSLINQFLNYPENSAGSLMTIEYVSLHEYYTVRKAMDHIRRTGVEKETVYTCYVVDAQRKLLGTVSLRKLIVAPESATIRDIMESASVFAYTQEDQEKVAEDFRHYDLMSLPVCDQEMRLVGIITVDDIVDVIQEENTEDFEKMAAITPSDEEYLKSSVWTLAKHRVPWLLLLMISATFTGAIITHFEAILSAMVVLTSFIPMLMDTAGHAGAQTTTLIIRGMALGELDPSYLPQVLWKELRVALMCGCLLATVNFARLILVSHQTLLLSATVSLSILCTVVIAKMVGCLLPMAAKKIKLDPAVMAAPMITTIVDACALMIYFFLAIMFLGL